MSVVAELRALVPAVGSAISAMDDEVAAASMSRVIATSLEITADGVRPSQAELIAVAGQWQAASRQWRDAIRGVREAHSLVGTTWAGEDAELCGNALTSFAALSEQPNKGCAVLAYRLGSLASQLEEFRVHVAAGRAGLAALQGEVGSAPAAEAKRCLQRLIEAFEDAENAGNRAALDVTGATEMLTFPPQLTPSLVAPFLRAVKWSRDARPTRKEAPKATVPKTTRPKVTPTIKLRNGKPVAAGKTRATVLSSMRKYEGVPYKWGGTTPRGFDCSGFVQYVYRKAGIRLPRTSAAQRRVGVPVPRSQARPGDLVCMPGHVGIYLGNGMMYDAPRTGKTIGARRIWTNNYTIVRVIKN